MSIKKFFLPHKSNGFRPHFFRNISVLFFLCLLVGSNILFSHVLLTLSRNDSYAAIFVGALLTYTNEARAGINGHELVTSPILTSAAQLKANDMAARGYFSHNTPEGKTPWYWFEKAGYKYQYAGENLAVNFVDSKDVTEAWLASPGHRANILNNNYKEIGIATAVGMYQGRETTFIVQMFGSPAARVAGAETDNLSLAEKFLASPKRSVIDLYALFAAFVAALLFGASVYEFKRHHKSIWLSGGALISMAMMLIAATLQFGQGLI